jgi:hypothetical protein
MTGRTHKSTVSNTDLPNIVLAIYLEQCGTSLINAEMLTYLQCTNFVYKAIPMKKNTLKLRPAYHNPSNTPLLSSMQQHHYHSYFIIIFPLLFNIMLVNSI